MKKSDETNSMHVYFSFVCIVYVQVYVIPHMPQES